MTTHQRPCHIDDLPSLCLELILSRVGDSPLPFSKLPDGGRGASHPLLTSTVSHRWRCAADAAVLSLSFKSTGVGEIHLQNLMRFPSLVKLTFQNCTLVPPTTTEEFALALAHFTPLLETLELDQLDAKSDGSTFSSDSIVVSKMAKGTFTAALARSLPVWQHLRNLDLGCLLREADHRGMSMLVESLSKHPALTRLSFAYSSSFFDPPLSLDDLCGTPAMRHLLSRLRELHLWCSLPPPPSTTATSAPLKSLHLIHDLSMDYKWDSLDWQLLQTRGCMAGLACLSIDDWEIGSLPATLGGLSGLCHLSLNGCYELKHLPTTLGNLRALESLNLQFCWKLRELPESLGGLKSLKRLYLVSCDSLRALPSSLEQLQSLTSLEIWSCSRLRRGVSVGALGSLKVLCLGTCGIGKLPECIGRLSQLQMLNISYQLWEELPLTVGSLRLLTELKVFFCPSLIALPEEVSDLSHLRVLILQGCRALERLPVGIGRLQSLRQLDIGHCKSLVALPPSLMQFTGLEKLSMMQVDILEGVAPLGLGAFGKLRELRIQASSAGPWLPQSLCQLSSLEVLSINLDKVSPTEIPVGWSFMQGLRNLRKVELVTSVGTASVTVAQSALAKVIWRPSFHTSEATSSAILEGLRSMGATVI